MNTSVSSKVEGRTIRVQVTAVNRGDEAAYNVRAELRVGDKRLLTDKEPELPVNGAYRAEFSAPVVFKTPGAYPLVLVMHYTDANQYPFSAMIAQTFTLGRDAESPIFGQLKSAAFSREGRIQLRLKNLGRQAVNVRSYLAAPRELTVNEESVAAVASPQSESSLGFNLKNFSALAGSTYQVFAISEFEADGTHFSSIAPGTVRIVAPREILGLSYPVIYSILGLLVLVFVGAQLLRWKKS